MKNIGVQNALGPLPAHPAGDDLPPARAAILRALGGQPEPAPIAALAAATGLHGNTVREHLEALEATGYVERLRAAPRGRGRPAWLYRVRNRAQAAAEGEREYAALAAALARAIHRTSERPAEDAALAGEEWGRELARPHRAPTTPPPTTRPDAAEVPDAVDPVTAPGPPDQLAARRTVVDVLEGVGFAPEADEPATDVRLTRCPLLAAAHEHPDVVCAVHLGLVRGALAELGAPAADVTLVPFAEPGACRLSMRHADGGVR